MKAILTNHKNLNESKVELDLVEPSEFCKRDFPIYSIRGRKTVWNTKKMIYMTSETEGRTLSAKNIPTKYLVEFI